MTPIHQTWPDDLARTYRAKGYWRGETFSAMLRRRAAERPDAIAIIDGDRRWTYAELLRRAEAAAAGFVRLGLVPGDRVVVQLGNIAELLSCMFGLFRAGMIPVCCLPAHRSAEVIHLARKSEARGYVIADRLDGFDYLAQARTLQAAVREVAHVVLVRGAAEGTTPLATEMPPSVSLPADGPSSAVAVLQISGGSTGLPKLIPRTHDDYLYSCRASNEICGVNSDSVLLVALPAVHNFPMSSPGHLGALIAGARVVLSPSPSPEACFRLIEKEKVTITGLVPPLALLWLQAAPTTRHDLGSLRVLLVGGAKCTPDVARRIQPVLGCTLQQVFGMAEGLVNYTRLDDPEELVVSTQGRPISDHDEILVVDDEDRPVPDGTPGHLLTRGPYTIRAYHDEPVANARSFTSDGYYRTGDIVRRLPGGYLEVRGRAGDHINRGGEKISAEEIEDHLLAHPAVFDAAVVSLPDPFLGERTCAFVIPRGEKPRASTLRSFMRLRGIAEFKVPDQIVFVDAFAATAVGKVSRKDLRLQLRGLLLGKTEGMTA